MAVDSSLADRELAGDRAVGFPSRYQLYHLQLVDSAFNYHLHGPRGFERLAQTVEACGCYEFTYSDLEQAAAVFAALE